jgi:hypothetical protein
MVAHSNHLYTRIYGVSHARYSRAITTGAMVNSSTILLSSTILSRAIPLRETINQHLDTEHQSENYGYWRMS